MPNPILDPTGGAGALAAPGAGSHVAAAARGSAGGGGFALASRSRSDLRGANVGLLINTKKNADIFLDELGRLLLEQHGAARVLARTKLNFAQPVTEDVLKELTTQCDVVITGVGDCGSCSAAAVTDGVLIESHGTPAAVICSDAFRSSADAMAGLRGAPGYQYATTPHPVAVLTAEQARERAAAVLPDVLDLLVAPAGGSTPG